MSGTFGENVNYRSRLDKAGNFEYFEHLAADFQKVTGWKVHLSVDFKDIQRAWNIVRYVVSSHVTIAKVVTDEVGKEFSDPTNSQAGKMITLYQLEGDDICSVIRDIEYHFRREGIQSGAVVKDDLLLAGSRYVYYRNDGNVGGRGKGHGYIDADDLDNLPAEQRYNPLCLANPFGSLSVNPDGPFCSLKNLPFNVLKIASAGLWQKAQVEGGDWVVRVPVGGPGQYGTEELRAALKGAGFENPQDHFSDRLGHTIRLSGNDLDRLRRLNQFVIASACPDAKVMSGGGLAFPVAGLQPEHKRALSTALGLFDINISADSQTKSLLVSKDDAQKIKTLAEGAGFRFEHQESQPAQKPVNPTRFGMR